MTEILLGGIFLFISKQDSRNALDLDRASGDFAANYERLFGRRLPHMDTIDDVLRVMESDELERIKAELVSILIEKKVFGKTRLLGTYYRVAIDATGVMTVKAGHCAHCLKKKSKSGAIICFHNILEAKLITPNGFAISLGSEWIENQAEYDKQDCELKAFKRLAEKLHDRFPRLPICIHGDGLYPNATFFDICKGYDWRYIVTLKEGSLKTLWEEIDLELYVSKNLRRCSQPQQESSQSYRWLALNYRERSVFWVECIEERKGKKNRFVYLTDLEATFDNVIELGSSGRLRFKIENEGFNTQKNLGYNLSHKFSRVSAVAMKNYVSLMQIAHMVNQLYELSSLARPLLVGKMTIKHLWKELVGGLKHMLIKASEVLAVCAQRIQIRYD